MVSHTIVLQNFNLVLCHSTFSVFGSFYMFPKYSLNFISGIHFASFAK